MPQLIQHPEELLLSLKKDLFILQITPSGTEDGIRFHHPDETLVEDVLKWFESRSVAVTKIASFAKTGCIEGWPGWYHVAFKDWDDPVLAEFSSVFENAEGLPLEPDRFRLVFMSYTEWLAKGGPEHYKKYLEEMNDDDF